jgi:hypothetical protein
MAAPSILLLKTDFSRTSTGFAGLIIATVASNPSKVCLYLFGDWFGRHGRTATQVNPITTEQDRWANMLSRQQYLISGCTQQEKRYEYDL